MTADIKTLERLAARLKQDALVVRALNAAAMLSIADIIERSIGAPLSWPVREAGYRAADVLYPGSPSSRHAFNHGVKWAVEQYQPEVTS